MDRESLKRWIDEAPEEWVQQLASLADGHVTRARELAERYGAPKRAVKPRRQRKPRAIVPPAAPLASAASEPDKASALAMDVRRMLDREPRRTYTLSGLARQLAAETADVAAALRQLQRDGRALCTGRGKAACWTGGNGQPASSPHAVTVPAAEPPEVPDAQEGL